MTTTRKRKGFPWGLALLGVGAFLLYKRSQGQLPGAAAATTALSDARNYLMNWANTYNLTDQIKQWIQTAPDEDISRLANVVHVWEYKQPDGKPYGYCPSSGPGTYPACYSDWQYIKSKYPVFSVLNY